MVDRPIGSSGKYLPMRSILRSLSFAGLALAAGIVTLHAQSFEGVIEFTKSAGPVVTNYRYFVKGDHIRIEEISSRGEVQGIMLVDIHDRTVMAVSPDRKLYMEVPNMRLPQEVEVQVQKTSELKEMAGYKCEKWLVKSPKEDRLMTYWVAADQFNFFVPLLETLNRKDEQAVMFLEMKGATDVFPMLGVEQKLDGAEVSRLEVTRVSKGSQKANLFEIPDDYNRFERN